MNKPESDLDRRARQHLAGVFKSRAMYCVLGGVGGAGLGIYIMINEVVPRLSSARYLLLLGASILFGALAGFDLHRTREWRRFGRLTFSVRMMLACSGAAATTGFVGYLLRLVPSGDVWAYSGGGALVGLIVALRLEYERLLHPLPNEELKPTATRSTMVE